MNKDDKIIVFGGDKRTIHMIQQFATAGLQVVSIGFDEIQFDHAHIKKETLSPTVFQNAKAVILPVGGTDERGKVVAKYTLDELIFTDSCAEQLPKDAVIYTGGANDYLIQVMQNHALEYVVLFERNDIAILNSIPTAEGTMQIAMEQTDHTIHQSNTMIIGFGRIAITMARLFKAVGANVTIVARSGEHRARIIEMGCSYLSFDKVKSHIHMFDICINTVPALILTKDIIDKLSEKALIIDVASNPGGVDFLYAKQSGIKTIHALGIPGKTAPVTAGHILADILIDLIQKQ